MRKLILLFILFFHPAYSKAQIPAGEKIRLVELLDFVGYKSWMQPGPKRCANGWEKVNKYSIATNRTIGNFWFSPKTILTVNCERNVIRILSSLPYSPFGAKDPIDRPILIFETLTGEVGVSSYAIPRHENSQYLNDILRYPGPRREFDRIEYVFPGMKDEIQKSQVKIDETRHGLEANNLLIDAAKSAGFIFKPSTKFGIERLGQFETNINPTEDFSWGIFKFKAGSKITTYADRGFNIFPKSDTVTLGKEELKMRWIDADTALTFSEPQIQERQTSSEDITLVPKVPAQSKIKFVRGITQSVMLSQGVEYKGSKLGSQTELFFDRSGVATHAIVAKSSSLGNCELPEKSVVVFYRYTPSYAVASVDASNANCSLKKGQPYFPGAQKENIQTIFSLPRFNPTFSSGEFKRDALQPAKSQDSQGTFLTKVSNEFAVPSIVTVFGTTGVSLAVFVGEKLFCEEKDNLGSCSRKNEYRAFNSYGDARTFLPRPANVTDYQEVKLTPKPFPQENYIGQDPPDGLGHSNRWNFDFQKKIGTQMNGQEFEYLTQIGETQPTFDPAHIKLVEYMLHETENVQLVGFSEFNNLTVVESVNYFHAFYNKRFFKSFSKNYGGILYSANIDGKPGFITSNRYEDVRSKESLEFPKIP
jgi:hypothetical protein